MGRWSREELEEAFENYQKVALEAFTSGDLNPWVDLFTEDCTYVEHYWGRFGGREAVRRWITSAMGTYPATEIKYYPIEWYVIDEEKGWVVSWVWNRMTDPGDGSIHQAGNVAILKYAGNGKWQYEEDVYNPKEFEKMIEGWEQAKERTGLGRGPGAH
ncbi:nuclear transport factor 2 family protein [Chloroflexota bacterium]